MWHSHAVAIGTLRCKGMRDNRVRIGGPHGWTWALVLCGRRTNSSADGLASVCRRRLAPGSRLPPSESRASAPSSSSYSAVSDAVSAMPAVLNIGEVTPGACVGELSGALQSMIWTELVRTEHDLEGSYWSAQSASSTLKISTSVMLQQGECRGEGG